MDLRAYNQPLHEMPLPRVLFIPNMAAKDASEAEANATDAEAPLLRVQKLSAQLLRGDEDTTSSAERIAWLALWSRAFNILDAARAATWKYSTLGLTLLERTALEAGLQVRVVVEPLLADQPAEDAHDDVRNRLRAFTAWALWSDRRVYQELASTATAEKAWDAEPARRLAKSDAVRNLCASVFGELELLNAHELDIEKAKYLERMNRALAFLNETLADPSLTQWVKEIETSKPRQFYQLFDRRHSSVQARMNASGHDYFYTVYRQESQVAHGGTLEPFLLMKDFVATPKLPREGADVVALADNVASLVGTQVVDLMLVKTLLWPRTAK